MAFTKTLREIPLDDYADSHGQIGARLKAGEFLDDPGVAFALASWGWDGNPIGDMDILYMLTHATNQRSIMAAFVAYLYSRELIGVVVDDDETVNFDNYGETLARLEEYGVVTATSGDAEKEFYVTRYNQNRLSSDGSARYPYIYDEPWMARERGLWLLPEAHEASEDADALYASLEKAIARYGLSGTKDDKLAALATSALLRDALVPGPGAQNTGSYGPGRRINPRRAYYRWAKVDDKLVQDNASDAAKRCPALAFVMGADNEPIRSHYDGLLSSQPISENEWRAVLGLPRKDSDDSSGLGIGGGRLRR